MHEKHWQYTLASLILLGAFTFPSFASEAPIVEAPASPVHAMPHRSAVRGGGRFVEGLNQSVGLTPEQADAVRGLMAEQRAEALSLRQKTDDRIRQLLSAEQQKKFDAFLAQQKAERSRYHKPA